MLRRHHIAIPNGDRSMNIKSHDLIQFLARYALCFVIPGLWFAYIGGASPWLGGTAGLAAAILLGIAVLLARRGDQRGKRNPLDNLLLDDSHAK
jgi:hypothetical protein